MGLYNFKSQFVRYVFAGSKTQTIRQRRRYVDQPGSTAHAYHGCRVLSPAVLLGRWLVVSVVPVVIDWRGQWVEVNGERLNEEERERFAWSDGFRPAGSSLAAPAGCFREMSRFWLDSELRLEADLIQWRYERANCGEWAPVRALLGSRLSFNRWMAKQDGRA